MNYEEAWKFLDDLQFFKIKLGLDSMRSFLSSLDNPQEKLKFVHIAGTNGKGSTAAALFSVLTEAGFKVGLYSSPHLSSVRERFKINEQYISEKQFSENSSKIRHILDGKQITYFEFTTTLALLWFASENVDLVIMEVGMGGRLDATNVIAPFVSIITNVSMDHEAYLGETLSAVAFEKAGIIKKGVPVVTGVSPDESRTVVVNKAQNLNAPLYLLGQDFFVSKENEKAWQYRGINQNAQYDKLVVGVPGFHQAENAALALAALELLQPYGFHVSEDNVRTGLSKTIWPGRLEYFVLDKISKNRILHEEEPDKYISSNKPNCTRYLLDGAHNPAGTQSLKRALHELFSYKSLIGIWASMADKDIHNSFLPIASLFDHIILTRPENDRSATPEEIKNTLPRNIQERVFCSSSVKMALKKADEIARSDDLVCIAGSLYLVGKARQILLGELVR